MTRKAAIIILDANRITALVALPVPSPRRRSESSTGAVKVVTTPVESPRETSESRRMNMVSPVLSFGISSASNTSGIKAVTTHVEFDRRLLGADGPLVCVPTVSPTCSTPRRDERIPNPSDLHSVMESATAIDANTRLAGAPITTAALGPVCAKFWSARYPYQAAKQTTTTATPRIPRTHFSAVGMWSLPYVG